MNGQKTGSLCHATPEAGATKCRKMTCLTKIVSLFNSSETKKSYFIPVCADLCEVIIVSSVVTAHISSYWEGMFHVFFVIHRTTEAVGEIVRGTTCTIQTRATAFMGVSRVYEYIFLFSTRFTKGNNFVTSCLLPWTKRDLLKCGLLLNERICSYRSKFFPLKVDIN